MSHAAADFAKKIALSSVWRDRRSSDQIIELKYLMENLQDAARVLGRDSGYQVVLSGLQSIPGYTNYSKKEIGLSFEMLKDATCPLDPHLVDVMVGILQHEMGHVRKGNIWRQQLVQPPAQPPTAYGRQSRGRYRKIAPKIYEPLPPQVISCQPPVLDEQTRFANGILMDCNIDSAIIREHKLRGAYIMRSRRNFQERAAEEFDKLLSKPAGLSWNDLGWSWANICIYYDEEIIDKLLVRPDFAVIHPFLERLLECSIKAANLDLVDPVANEQLKKLIFQAGSILLEYAAGKQFASQMQGMSAPAPAAANQPTDDPADDDDDDQAGQAADAGDEADDEDGSEDSDDQPSPRSQGQSPGDSMPGDSPSGSSQSSSDQADDDGDDESDADTGGGSSQSGNGKGTSGSSSQQQQPHPPGTCDDPDCDRPDCEDAQDLAAGASGLFDDDEDDDDDDQPAINSSLDDQQGGCLTRQDSSDMPTDLAQQLFDAIEKEMEDVSSKVFDAGTADAGRTCLMLKPGAGSPQDLERVDEDAVTSLSEALDTLKEAATQRTLGLKRGDLASSLLAKLVIGEDTVFSRQMIIDEVSLRLGICLDLSGSIGYHQELMLDIVAGFVKALKDRHDIDLVIVGYNTTNSNARTSIFRMWEPDYDEARMEGVHADGYTPTLPALKMLMERLDETATQQRERTLLLSVTDGEPNVGGESRDVRAWVEQQTDAGIEVVGIGVNTSQAMIASQYPKSVCIDKFEELPGLFKALLEDVLLESVF